MEDETEENNLNELFVQETLDPRIESVMPILNKLHKKVAEMKEVNELSEWADNLTEVALEEGDGGQQAINPMGVPESEENLDEARVFGYDIKRVPDLKVSYDDAQELKNQLGMLQKVMMYSTPDGMSPEIRSRVKDIYFKITNILQRNGLQESDLMSMGEGMFDKVKDTVKTVGSKVFDKLGGGSEEDLLKDLKIKAGVRNPENGKPSMAQSDVEKRTDEVDMGQADSSLRSQPKQNNDKMDHFTALGKASKKMGHDHFMDVPDDKLEALKAMVKRFRAGEEVDESALQAYLGNKKYGKDGMKKLRQAGQEDASEKEMQNIRAHYSDKEEPITEVGDTPAGLAAVKKVGQRADRALGDAGTGYSGSEVDNLDKTYAARDRANSIVGRERIKANDKNPTRVVGEPNHGNRMEEVTEDGEFAGDYATGEAGQWRNKGPKANKPATIGDLVGEGEEKKNDSLDPWKHVSPRVDNPKIKGTDKRAKSAYYPTPKPPVKKLDTPLTNETVAEGSEDLARILNIAGIKK
jgi:hypothetical protein